MEKHLEFPYRTCVHCKGFAPAAPRRAWILVSESISGLLLSQPVLIIGLSGHYPGNNLIKYNPILSSDKFFPELSSYLLYPQFPEIMEDLRAG